MSAYPQIPGYQVLRVLGQGGMATVYLAIQEKLKREVAIKVLSPHFLQDREFSSRFMREAETAAKLRHLSIIPIYDVGETGSSPYIVMEHLEESLKARIERAPLDPSAALRIVWQVADALNCAHREGLVHRDIKPENIMFRKDGTAVLMDFGIAKAAAAMTALTKTGTSIGSPYYMSPEQARGQKLDGRSDIYSLGCVFYEMLTGEVPYEAEDVFAVGIRHIQDPIPTLPGKLNRFQPLLELMMAKKRETRISNAEELISIIQKYWTGQAPAVEPRRVAQERPTYVQPADEASWTSEQDLAPKRSPWLIPVLVAMLVILAAVIGAIFIYQKSPSRQEAFAGGSPMPVHRAASIQNQSSKAPASETRAIEGQVMSGAGQSANSGERSEDKETLDDDFNRWLIQAQDQFAQGNYTEAAKALREAKRLKTTYELGVLEQKVSTKLLEIEQEQKIIAQDDSAYEMASRQNTEEAFRAYLDAYPNGRHRDEAGRRMAERADHDAFEAAKKRDTSEAYQNYLESFPKGLHSTEAIARRDILREQNVTLLELISEYDRANKEDDIILSCDYLGKAFQKVQAILQDGITDVHPIRKFPHIEPYVLIISRIGAINGTAPGSFIYGVSKDGAIERISPSLWKYAVDIDMAYWRVPNIIWALCYHEERDGAALYSTMDSGRTWSHSTIDRIGVPGTIKVDDTSAATLYISAMRASARGGFSPGIYKTTDGGMTWAKILYINAKTGFYDIVIDPFRSSIVYCSSLGKRPGLFKTQDGGKTWKLLAFPYVPQGAMIKIMISQMVRDKLYALVFRLSPKYENQFGNPFLFCLLSGDCLKSSELLFSNDGGESWSK